MLKSVFITCVSYWCSLVVTLDANFVNFKLNLTQTLEICEKIHKYAAIWLFYTATGINMGLNMLIEQHIFGRH